MEEKVLKLKE